MSRRIQVGLLSLSLVVMGLSIFVAHATAYSPAVSAGEWGKYAPLYDICKSTTAGSCAGLGSGGVNDTDYALIQIVGVSGTEVTVHLFTQYKNGTSSAIGGMVDVSTGISNLTSIGGSSGTPDYFVTAGGLQAGDTLWSSPSAPKINTTSTDQVLGASRSVNLVNMTTFSKYPGVSFYLSTIFRFDQQSGMLLSFAFNSTTTTTYGITETRTTSAFAFGMVDNNIWLSSTLPSFSMNSIASFSFQTGASGTAIITFAGSSGYSSNIRLSVSSPAGLSCTLGQYTVKSSDSVTLTCTGRSGSYVVTVRAYDGYNAPRAQTSNVTVNNAQAVNAPSPLSGFPITYVIIGLVVAAGVGAALAVFIIRRKPTPGPGPAAPAQP